MHNRNSWFTSPMASSVAAVIALAGSGAQAQQATLEEVVVTAQKREQSLQDTPVAVTALGEMELEQRGIKDITDLGTIVPNVTIAQMPTNTGKAAVAIRGSVTSNPAITWEPTVGIYLDNVYMGKISGNIFKVAELERIEVLRGPQGTLYGKNTIGGAINLITTQPSGDFAITARAGTGNYDYRDAYIAADLPALALGDLGEIRTRLSYSREQRDGFYDNAYPPEGSAISNPFVPGATIPANPRSNTDTMSELDRWSGRLDVLWDVNERLSLRYVLDASDADNTSNKEQLTHVDPDNMNLGVPIPADLSAFIVDEDTNADSISTDNPSLEEFESTSHSLTVSYDLPLSETFGDMTLRYIANRREMNFYQIDDNDGTPFSLFHSIIDEEYEQVSHELQLTGTGERFNYVLGLYSFDEEADVFNPLIPLNSIIGPLSLDHEYGLDAEQIAVYGQADYRPRILDDRLTLTAGVRWSQEKKDSYIIHPGEFEGADDDEWTNVAPTFIVAYDFSDDVNGYAKYSKGWKAGGFNGEAQTLAGFMDGYDPEEVDAWEVGLKSRLLDGRLQVNTALFYNDEQDLQLSVFTSGSAAATEIRNAGEAVKMGAEIELVYQPVTDLLLTANIGLLDAEYEEYMEFDASLGREVNLKDERANQYAPSYNYNLGAEYTVARLGKLGTLTGRLDYSYSDDYVPYVTPEQNATSQIDSYGVLNGRISLAEIPIGDETLLNISLWGKNLTDEEYRLNTIPFGPWTVSFFGDPRTYGIEATVDFR